MDIIWAIPQRRNEALRHSFEQLLFEKTVLENLRTPQSPKFRFFDPTVSSLFVQKVEDVVPLQDCQSNLSDNQKMEFLSQLVDILYNMNEITEISNLTLSPQYIKIRFQGNSLTVVIDEF